MKKLTSLFIAITLLIALVPYGATAAANIKIGDYLTMGKYYGESILWRCVDIDENGPLMLSDKIICLKAFDASGTNTIGSHHRGYIENGTKGYYRQMWGSNYWQDSNLRDWLNSSAAAGNVVWSCGNPPDAAHLWKGNNAYDKEAGFLYNFTASERNAIKTVTQKTLLNGYEYSEDNTINPSYHKFEWSISTVVQNYDSAYSEDVSDKMFLLDAAQVNSVYQNASLLGSDYCMAYPSAQAVEKSEYKESDLSPTQTWHYWLRLPYSHYDSYERNVNSDGNISNITAYCDYVGVRPAFYMDAAEALIASGAGSAETPYVLTSVSGVSCSATAEYDYANRKFDFNGSINSTLPGDKNAAIFIAIYASDGKLAQIKAQYKTIESGASIDFAGSIAYAAQSGTYSMVFYVWDKDKALVPLCTAEGTKITVP